MSTIRIESNPYKKEVSFWQLGENGEWEKLKLDNDQSELREHEAEKVFLPFKIDEMIKTIRKEYYAVGGEKVKVVFKGTEDEYNEVLAVCDNDEAREELELIKDDEYLYDARDILKNTKEIFYTVKPILDDLIGDEALVKKNLNKVSDALDDIIPICVFGNYSSGKSTFINALIGYEILPSDDCPVTAKIYKISRSYQDDRINISFIFENEKYEMIFDSKTHRINNNTNNKIVSDINEAITEVDSEDMITRASAVLNLLNDYSGDFNEDIINIEVPFNKEGILGKSINKYIIFDTPGSNSNSNKEHEVILAQALDGFSNGIPVWVCRSDTMDTIDNAKLCNSIFEIEALDKRFTMIIVNKADDANFSKREVSRIMDYDAIRKMYSSGIFYVSSIIGLGSKIKGLFNNEHLDEVFCSKETVFSNKENRHYKTLYKYNIMPAQYYERALKEAENESNLLYVNSGLLCVEQEMETFATRHSSYNKCRMVYKFLDSVIDNTNLTIEDNKRMLTGYRAQEQDKLDAKQRILKERIERDSEAMEKEFDKSSKAFVKAYVKEKLQFTQTVDEIDQRDKEYTTNNELEHNFSAVERDYIDSKDKRISNLKKNIQGLFSKGEVTLKDVIDTYKADNQELRATKENLDATKKEIDKATSDSLIHDVRVDYRKHMQEVKEIIDSVIKDYWKTNAENFKKDLANIVTESEALSLQERNEIQNLIINYEPLVFDDGADDIFVKARFMRSDSEKLNNKRLVESFNNRVSKNTLELAKYRNERCKDSFIEWEKKLRTVIDTNITEYNPELRMISRNITRLSESIHKLEKNQNEIQRAFETIGNMMAWKNINE